MIAKRVLHNAKWIVLCRIAQALLQLIVGMITARYLGPANYGLIGYAGSIAAFALPLMQLGLPSTLVQELIEAPEAEGRIMGTALVLDLLSGIVSIGLVCAFVSVANHGETETLIVCALYSVSLLFRALEVMQCWFQYKLASKYASVVMLCAYITVSAYKVFLLATAKSIHWFALANAIDSGLVGFALVCIYRRMGAQKLTFAWPMAKRLLKRSRYYILSSMMVTVFQHTDHVMLKMFSSDAENGVYTAAVTCTATCHFLYSAIVDSMRPVILEDKKRHSPDYGKNVSGLYSTTIYLALFQGTAFTIFAELLVRVMYGDAYLAAVPVLRIIVWQVSFAYMGSVRNIWILAQGQQQLVWRVNLCGALMNAAVNFLLIPKWGACGAAAASLATQIFTNFILGFIIKPLRENNRLLLAGLNPRTAAEFIHGLLRGRGAA